MRPSGLVLGVVVAVILGCGGGPVETTTPVVSGEAQPTPNSQFTAEDLQTVCCRETQGNSVYFGPIPRHECPDGEVEPEKCDLVCCEMALHGPGTDVVYELIPSAGCNTDGMFRRVEAEGKHCQ